MDPEAKLDELGLELPEPPTPVAAYVPSVRTGNLLFVSGQIPSVDGQLEVEGIVGRDLKTDRARELAQRCALNGLAVAKGALGSLSRITRVVRVEGFVASTPEFTDQPQVINGASELLGEVFGDAGRHSRIAVGAPSLPLNAPVEVAFTFEVRD